MKWTKDQVLTNAVCIFIKNKVNSLYPNVGIRRKATQRLFFHNLALHGILLSLESSLSFGSCVDLHVWLSSKHYMRESVGGAKQAVMSKQALIYFSEGGAYPHYYIIG